MILHKHEGMKHCVNPDCLVPGDGVDNARDFVNARGLYSVKKLTREKAAEIRESGLLTRELALVYGVSSQMITRIRRGAAWKVS